MRRVAMSFVALAILVGGLAKADHNSPSGSVGLLMSETEELEQAVRYSYLRYEVKNAVFQFSYDVQALVSCVRYGARPIIHDHLDDMGCPSHCSMNLSRAQSSFRLVSRYLWDTQYDFPQVYQAYQEVQRALSSISTSVDPYPGPGPSSYSCVAVDRGWEEHFGGHVGYGRNLRDAQMAALRECEHHHGRCVIQRCQ